MKICWDNLNFLRYSNKTKKWYGKNTTFIYREKCPECQESYLGRERLRKNQKIEYCSIECHNKNNKGNLGGKLSKKTLEKMSIAQRNRWSRERKLNPEKPKPNKSKYIFTEKHKRKISESNKGKHNQKNNKNFNWKGGYRKNCIPRYDLYKRLNRYEKIRRNEKDYNILEVQCCVCQKWHIPKLHQVVDRLAWIETGKRKESLFYCSEKCKKECPVYNKKSHIKGYEPKLFYPNVWPEIREKIKQRDNYKCQNIFCENETTNSYNITVHHIDYDRNNMLENNLITVCRSCNSIANGDKEWHQCFYNEIIRRKLKDV